MICKESIIRSLIICLVTHTMLLFIEDAAADHHDKDAGLAAGEGVEAGVAAAGAGDDAARVASACQVVSSQC